MILNDADPGIGIMPDTFKNVIMKKKMSQDMPKFKNNFALIHEKFQARVAARPNFYKDMAKFVTGEDE
jgi:hypothetical protein